MKIGLVTQFLPRMELDHLDEWIDYHLTIGISKIYLYNNGHLSVDPIFGSGKPGRVWEKKPEANYHLDYTDSEVDAHVADIIGRYRGKVISTQWDLSVNNHIPQIASQIQAVNHQLNLLKQNKEIDVLGHFDVDELIVCEKLSLRQNIIMLLNNYAALTIYQKVFNARWLGNVSIPYNSITENRGYSVYCPKLFGSVAETKKWLSPHKLKLHEGSHCAVQPDLIRFHHFRGYEYQCNAKVFRPAIEFYQQMKSFQKQYDCSHCLMK